MKILYSQNGQYYNVHYPMGVRHEWREYAPLPDDKLLYIFDAQGKIVGGSILQSEFIRFHGGTL